jgi:hypothetical protein
MMAKKEEYLKSPETFMTYDLGLASALATFGYELWAVDKANPSKAQFIFRRDEGIDGAVNDYWNNNLAVNARSIIDNQKMIKNRLYSQ